MAIEHLQNPARTRDVRRGTDVETCKQAFHDHLFHVLGRFPATSTANDEYLALAYSVRDHLLDRWVKASETYYRKRARTVCYLSAEFLMGPHLGNNLVNLGTFDTTRQAMQSLGLDFEKLLEQEAEPGLGQWRPRAARGLLPRFARNASDPIDRSRHPLRVRDIRPADPRRLAGGDDGQVASPRQSVGDPAP